MTKITIHGQKMQYHKRVAISVSLTAGTGGTATFTPATGTSYVLSSLPIGTVILLDGPCYSLYYNNTRLGTIDWAESPGYREKYISISRGGVLIEITSTPITLQDGDNIIVAFEPNVITIGLYSDVNIHWEYNGRTYSNFVVPYDAMGIQVNIEPDAKGNYHLYLTLLDASEHMDVVCICPSNCIINSVLLDGLATTTLYPPYSGSPYATTVSYDELDGVFLTTNQYGSWYDSNGNQIDFVPLASGSSNLQVTLDSISDGGAVIFQLSNQAQAFGYILKYVPYNGCAITSLKYDWGNRYVDDERSYINAFDTFEGESMPNRYLWESYSGGNALMNNLMNNQGYCLADHQPQPIWGINYMIQSDRDNSKYFLIEFSQSSSGYMVGIVDDSGNVLQYYCFSYNTGPLLITNYQFYQMVLYSGYSQGQTGNFKEGIRQHTPIYSTAQIGYLLDDYFF